MICNLHIDIVAKVRSIDLAFARALPSEIRNSTNLFEKLILRLTTQFEEVEFISLRAEYDAREIDKRYSEPVDYTSGQLNPIIFSLNPGIHPIPLPGRYEEMPSVARMLVKTFL